MRPTNGQCWKMNRIRVYSNFAIRWWKFWLAGIWLFWIFTWNIRRIAKISSTGANFRFSLMKSQIWNRIMEWIWNRIIKLVVVAVIACESTLPRMGSALSWSSQLEPSNRSLGNRVEWCCMLRISFMNWLRHFITYRFISNFQHIFRSFKHSKMIFIQKI